MVHYSISCFHLAFRLSILPSNVIIDEGNMTRLCAILEGSIDRNISITFEVGDITTSGM